MAEQTNIGARRALGIIIPLFLVSVFLACLIISVANDMYAFVKPDKKEILTVSSPINDKQLSLILKEKGIIKNDLVFLMYLRSKGKGDDISLLLGEWTLNSNMSYREILLEIF
ncbi:MAG: endolytic transglycosylase MltG [Ruminococcaceae bacterium]|nr:endolytic transglycosylase MltG [Oscillospiraceae bacterium]